MMSAKTNNYFQIAKPIDKKTFLSAFEDTISVSILLVAPFGLPTALTDIMEEKAAEEELSVLCKSYEDIISRKLYSWRGIPDERISASLHKFLEQEQDMEVIDALRQAQRCIHSILNPDAVTDMTPLVAGNSSQFSKVALARLEEYNICTPAVAAAVLDKVLRALKHVYSAAEDQCRSSSTPKSIFAADENIWNLFRIHVPLRNFQPHELLKTGSDSKPIFEEEGIRSLQAALTVESHDGPMRLSLEQYYMLLELFQGSREVQDVVFSHCYPENRSSSMEQLTVARRSLDELRSGCHPALLFACAESLDSDPQPVHVISSLPKLLVHPTVSYVEQLQLFLTYSKSSSSTAGSTSSSVDLNSNLPLSIRSRRRAAEVAIRIVKEAIKLRHLAKLATEVGDVDRAVEYISAALQGRGTTLLERDAEEARNAGAGGRNKKSKESSNKKGQKKSSKGKKKRGDDDFASNIQNMFEQFMYGGGFEHEGEDDEEEYDNDDGDDEEDEDEEEGYPHDDDDHEDQEEEEDGDVDQEDEEEEENEDGYYDNEGEPMENVDMRDLLDMMRKQFAGSGGNTMDDTDDEEGSPSPAEGVAPVSFENVVDDKEEPAETDVPVEAVSETAAAEESPFIAAASAAVDVENVHLDIGDDLATELQAIAIDVNNTKESERAVQTAVHQAQDIIESIMQDVEESVDVPHAGSGFSSKVPEREVEQTRQQSTRGNVGQPFGNANADDGNESDLDEAFPSATVPGEHLGNNSYQNDADNEDPDEVIVEVDPSRLLPVHLKTSLLGIRAQYLCELGQFDAALADCAACLAMDPRNSRIHALRSQIYSGYLAQQELERGEAAHHQDDEENQKRQDMLVAAAKDSLAAFVLSGCTDLEMASAAEEASREACRAESRNVFAQRSRDETAEMFQGEQFLPKAWLLKSFFSGYDHLAASFGLEDAARTLFGDADDVALVNKSRLVNGFVEDSLVNSTDSGSSTNDIDEDMNDIDIDESGGVDATTLDVVDAVTGAAFQLQGDLIRAVPNSLKDLCIGAPSSESNGYLVHSLDGEAFRILSKLVDIIDREADDDDNDDSMLPSIDDDADQDQDQDDEAAEDMFVGTSEQAASEEELLQFAGEGDQQLLLDWGQLQQWVPPGPQRPRPTTSGIAGLKDGSFFERGEGEDEEDRAERLAFEERAVELQRHVDLLIETTDELLRRGLQSTRRHKKVSNATPAVGEADSSSNTLTAEVERLASSSSLLCPPSNAFQQCLQVLRSEAVVFMTGVYLNESGALLRVDSIPSFQLKGTEGNKDDDDEEGEWEDCDDDEEDDEDADEDDMDNDDEADQQGNNGEAEAINILHNRCVSFALCGRLLSLCSSITYLAGDSKGAASCLRQALVCIDNTLSMIDYISNKSSSGDNDEERDKKVVDESYRAATVKFRVDTLVKLAALLTDMDEVTEAKAMFTKAEQLSQANVYIALHWAELQIHENRFSDAIALLRKAKRLSVYGRATTPSPGPGRSSTPGSDHNRERAQRSLAQLQASVYCLLGVALFRQSPAHPEVALGELREGVDSLPRNIYLQLCLGEVTAQVGDAVTALHCFEKACKIEPLHPLPYVNAARTYQQLGQQAQARRHITRAIALDPTLAMTRVDLAQQFLHGGHSSQALAALRDALLLARHVSEIHDVLTAKYVAEMQLQLELEGLYSPIVMR